MSDIPYPGLRPFTKEESHLFFGREKQIDALLDKLALNRFISVTGLSGCGKSSLVRAGLLPNLELGYFTEAGAEWTLIEMRPGINPLKNLARALKNELPSLDEDTILHQLSSGEYLHLELKQILQTILSTTPHQNFLFLIDQFEELFRYETQGSFDERKFFVDLLLLNATLKEAHIYIVITIRSDYLGECAVFSGLPEIMNAGQFFVPQLTQEELRQVIVKPAQLVGGNIQSPLLLRLLQEVEHEPDQLPVLQHCLMRMWGKAQQNCDPKHVELQPSDYENVGGLQYAISRHANKIFEPLSSAQRNIAERMFRFLVDPTESRDSRHPVQYKDLVAVTEAADSEEELRDIIDKFRDPSCCFLVSPNKEELHADSEIDLSHEALISHWDKLKKWKNDEKESMRNYQFLLEVFDRRKGGEKGWLEPPELEIILNWRKEHQPNKKWAERYGGEFEKAIKFLDDSKQTQEEKHQREEQKRQEELHRTRWQRTWAVIGLIIALILAGWALWERSNAERAREKTEQALQTAEDKQREAEEAQAEAELNSLRFQQMVNATFGFLSESGQNKEFFDWVQEASTVEQLMPALELMIELSESMSKEEKDYWLRELPTMPDEFKIELLYILGKAAAEKARGQ